MSNSSFTSKMTLSNEKEWPSVYSCTWLEQGLVSYEDVGAGVALLKKETIERCMPTLVGKPVIIDHIDVTPKDFKEEAVGYVTRVWFNPVDGWFWCDFLLHDDKGKQVVAKGYSVSCSFDVKATNRGGEYHAIPFDEELTELEFTHLALVETPRYEECKVYANSKGASMVTDKKKENATNLDAMSPIQLDKYMTSLSDTGLQLLSDGEYSENIKKAVKLHQDQRVKEKEEQALAGGGGGAQKKGKDNSENMSPKENAVDEEKVEAFLMKLDDQEVPESQVVSKVMEKFDLERNEARTLVTKLVGRGFNSQEVRMFGKKKEQEVKQKWNAAEAFVTTEDGSEISVEDLVKHYNATKSAKKNEEEDKEVKETVKGAKKNEDEEEKGEEKKNKSVAGDGDGDADDIGKRQDPVKETNKKNEEEEKKEDKKNGEDEEKEEKVEKKEAKKNKEEDEEEEKEETIKRNQDKPNHFVRLNGLREAGAEFAGVAVDLLSNKIERGKSRYGSTATK